MIKKWEIAMKLFEVDLANFYDVKSAKLKCYIQDIVEESKKGTERPAIIVVPGGGYLELSTREKEPIAMKFLSEGYNVFILEYSVGGDKFPTQVLQLGASIAYLRSNCEELLIDKNKIAIQGSSAGGHLCASYSCLYNSVVSDELKISADTLKPNAVVLAYPVITYGEFAHKGSFENLCGANEILKEKLSVQNLVGKQTPTTFIFHTVEDQAVPVENALLYVNALRKNDVRFELHIFNDGKHGLSTCEFEVAYEDRQWSYIEKEASVWIDLAIEFLAVNLKYDKFLDNKRGKSRF